MAQISGGLAQYSEQLFIKSHYNVGLQWRNRQIMRSKHFSEYEDVFLWVNYAISGGDYDFIEKCFLRTRSKKILKRRFENHVRYFPIKLGYWSKLEDKMIRLWGDMQTFLDPWEKLAIRFRRRPADVKERYRRLVKGPKCWMYSNNPNPKRVESVYRRGKRVLEVTMYILSKTENPTPRLVKKIIDTRRAIDNAFGDIVNSN